MRGHMRLSSTQGHTSERSPTFYSSLGDIFCYQGTHYVINETGEANALRARHILPLRKSCSHRSVGCSFFSKDGGKLLFKNMKQSKESIMQDVTALQASAEKVRARELTYSMQVLECSWSGIVGIWFIIASIFLAHIDWKTLLKTLLCSKDMLGPCEGNYAPPFGAKHCAGFSGYGTVRPDMKHFTNNIYVKNNTQYKVRIGCKVLLKYQKIEWR